MSKLASIDSHLHFLDTARFEYPWIEDSGQIALRGGYSPAEWQADVGEREVIAGTHLQAEVDHVTDPVAETSWLASLPEPVGPIVFVGYADLREPGLVATLERHRRYPAFRGIRQEAWFDPGSNRADLPRENMLLDPAWAAGLETLPGHGLSFDLLVWWHQLQQAAELLRDLPGLVVVLEHVGMPPFGDEAEMEVWRRGLRQLAAQVPGAVLKITGVAGFLTAAGWDEVRDAIQEGIEAFGPDRCMFGSNFPVERAAASYEEIWQTFERLVEGYSEVERAEMFQGTARRAYRIELENLLLP